MIESFTMWRVKDREFTDYAEAVRYENETNEAVKDIEFFVYDTLNNEVDIENPLPAGTYEIFVGNSIRTLEKVWTYNNPVVSSFGAFFD